MLNYISKKWAKGLANATCLSDEEDILRYGIEIILGYSMKIIVLCLISYFSRFPLEVLLVTATFVLLRVTTGGVHLPTYLSCFIFSLFWLWFLAWVAYQSPKIIEAHLLLIIHFSWILGLMICFKYGSNHEKKERGRKRGLFVLLLSGWYFFITFGYFLNVHFSYLIASILGLWLQLIFLTPLGVKGIKLLNQMIKGEEIHA